MILSALLTSVGINLGLCLLFFTLYSILRKQPGNYAVYAPRLVAQRKSEQRSDFNLERLIPSAGWIRQAWQPSEQELLMGFGLDTVVAMRIFVFGLRVFTFAGIVGIVILLPINYSGNQLSDDDSDLPDISLDSFSISNVEDGSNWLWVHFCAAYALTGVVCYLLYNEYGYISSKIIDYFYASKPLPHQFTVLVRGIPVSVGDSVSEKVGSFFSEFYPTVYLSHSVVRRTSKLHSLINEVKQLRRKLARLKLNGNASNRHKREGFLGIFGRRVNVIDYYEKKLEDLQEQVRMEQSSLAGKEVPAAFVSFKSRLGAATVLHIQQRINPTVWVTEQAPDHKDIHWVFFSTSFLRRFISYVLVVVACIVITILFLIPVAIVQGLTNLEQLETWLPFLKGILRLAFIRQVITGYLPSLILQLFVSLIPPVMIMLSTHQGYVAYSQIEKSACIKVLFFTMWNIFFANALSGSALYQIDVILDPKNIPRVLAEAVPGQASFFIAYVVTSGWTGVSSELFRLLPLISNYCRRLFCKKDDEHVEVPSTPYHSQIPKILVFELLGLTYFFLAPLILPFILIFYCMGYIVYRNQILNVYMSKYETSGKFWPLVHSSTIFSLVLMHVIAIGLFTLKKLPLASALILPLPILTLLFNEYCKRRFLPLFKAYPAECLIKKDKENQNEPTMGEFYDKLATAYEDPALKAREYYGATGTNTSPLLRDTGTS
ncbi:CSC1-like protein HYP1 [Punica granatum]|uniref:CSC1-like protein HYP1 n=2 Tax=Punica granatum TaxID=22663 RepID=A0A6P8DN92_PUNGR|nr:CSC1-like protein HYP1 [Punica granatum]XP_031398852.1 CSC1-like protein HYP1 [Punica granatum]XP_031398853.1 CSC1-like protein HYP1 [Punica granatum]XP_031398854.1 CSC1-like protein HYP1 [Punica granatum]XP_031398855.1 CSC1-like protein HYP1 [Punica granatum]XP_031398857.1 CSC1-like protein HYP1 [Punica granatum]OWM64559.1 hypothetical protein CDL15_Pgr020526 [Punica granatum]PKI47917.1 hypothetical protein CRG98_031701 [Punica granatum]